MKLSQDIIKKIEAEYNEWCSIQYGGNDEKQRKALGQFYTPPVLTVKMLEKFEDLNGNILDPTIGAGGLIAAAVLGGADPRKCFGIELDPNIIKVTRARLVRLGVPPWNIKQGDALADTSYDFDTSDNEKNFLRISMKDLGMSKLEINLTICKCGNPAVNKKFKLNLLDQDEKLAKAAQALFDLFTRLDENDYWYLANEKFDSHLILFNRIFKKYLNRKYKFSNKRIEMKEH